MVDNKTPYQLKYLKTLSYNNRPLEKKIILELKEKQKTGPGHRKLARAHTLCGAETGTLLRSPAYARKGFQGPRPTNDYLLS